MHKYWFAIVMLFAISCGSNAPGPAKTKPVTPDDFFTAFAKLKLPFTASDTAFKHLGDTLTIQPDVLKQVVPDSALTTLLAKKGSAPVIHPVGKIENKNEVYLLATIASGKAISMVTFLFDKNKHYVNHLLLLSTNSNDGYVHTVDINTEPTFTITRAKTVHDQYSYSRKGYAYNNAEKSFIVVINDGNENAGTSDDIINPIDTLPKTFAYSGDYSKDKTNFISLRDGNMPNKYTFFLQMQKNKGDCVGELKGMLTMVSANKAVFQQSGDPCVIDFTFSKTSIKVKERGSCGNHRGMNCMFDDSYKRKVILPAKETKKGHHKAK